MSCEGTYSYELNKADSLAKPILACVGSHYDLLEVRAIPWESLEHSFEVIDAVNAALLSTMSVHRRVTAAKDIIQGRII